MPDINTKLIATICLLFLITGCSSKSPKLSEKAIQLESIKSEETPEDLLSRAMVANEPTKGRLLLRSSQLYWQNGLIGQSKATLAEVDYRYLTPEQFIVYLKLRTELAMLESDKELLAPVLSLTDQFLNQAPVEQQIETVNIKLAILAHLEKHIEAAILLAESIGLHETTDLTEINERIWSELKLADTSQLTQYEYPGDHYDVRGWLALAESFKLNLQNLDAQIEAILAWNEAWPAHPAFLSPPKEIQILKSLPQIQPTDLTLALPLTGPLSEVGKAIRDGFFAAYYNQEGQTSDSKIISLFDTNAQDIEQLYQLEHSENALVVGPLDKASLARISELDTLSVNTLALNQSPSVQKHENLFQFSLDPEAGIDQIAQKLIQKDLKRIAVIAPEEEWGLRVHDKFQLSLVEQSGTLIESAFYSDQASLSKTVARLLATQQSSDRRRKIQRLTGIKLESEPRRRKDIDAIFMIAKPQTAKSLKPLFSFHYASQLPVYASSQIHNPNSENKDLNGVQFVEMPWMLTSTDQTKIEISKNLPGKSESYSRFYALGVDAFKLTNHLTILNEIPGSQLQGKTGLLSMNEDGMIERTMEWAKFSRGKAIPIRE